MTQSSEERVLQSPDSPPSARIIPFERPVSELQRAVQQRAQERIEAEEHKPKVSKTRRLVTFAVALIPVTIIFSGFLVAVHAVRVITSLYATPTKTTSQPVEAAPEAPEPGVVILVPDSSVAPKPAPEASAPAQPAP
jgi:hypothetical protein